MLGEPELKNTDAEPEDQRYICCIVREAGERS